MAAKAKPKPAAAPDRRALVTAVEVGTLDQAEAALQELGELQALSAKVGADQAVRVKEVVDQFAKKLVLSIDEQEVALADRVADLQQVLQEFAEGHRDELFPGKEKSRKLMHGVLGFRLSRPRLDDVEDDTPKEKTLIGKLQAALMAALLKLKGFGKLPLGQMLRVNVSPDKPALLKAVGGKTVTKAQLARLGLVYVGNEESFYAEPTAAAVQSHTAAVQ